MNKLEIKDGVLIFPDDADTVEIIIRDNTQYHGIPQHTVEIFLSEIEGKPIAIIREEAPLVPVQVGGANIMTQYREEAFKRWVAKRSGVVWCMACSYFHQVKDLVLGFNTDGSLVLLKCPQHKHHILLKIPKRAVKKFKIPSEEKPLGYKAMAHRSRKEGGSKWTRNGVNWYAVAENTLIRYRYKHTDQYTDCQATNLKDLDADWYPYRSENE